MKKPDFKKYWKATASFWVKGLNGMVHWPGWKNLFGLPLLCLTVLSIGCAMGLVSVFTAGLEYSPIGYCLYPLSAYCLTALCVRFPGAARDGKRWIADHPRLSAALHNSDRKFTRKLYRDQIINFAYGSYKIGAGIVYGSAWIGCDGIYNFAQALIQLFQILRRKQAGTLEQQWKSYRFCGALILMMHLTLIGLVFQMINWNRAVEQGEILVITTAFFAFYKIITSFIRIAKDRKHARPIDSSIRMLNLAQAFFAIFSLQASMFHTFGTGESWEHGMNILTGCAVCLLVVSIGIYMIRRGNREIKKLREVGYGE